MVVGCPKFPRNADSNYLLSHEMRRSFVKQDHLLRMPLSLFGDLSSHINILPEDKLMELNSEDVYQDIKSTLYKIMTNDNQSIEIPVTLKPFIQQTYNYFSSKKVKDRFIKEYKLEVESKQPRIRQRKIAEARKDTYQRAQILGIDLTNRGLDEFAQEYNNSPQASTSGRSSEATTTDLSPQASTSRQSPEATTDLSPQALASRQSPEATTTDLSPQASTSRQSLEATTNPHLPDATTHHSPLTTHHSPLTTHHP